MYVRIWTWLSVGALMLLALPINNASAAQSTNQTDKPKRASRATTKSRGPQPIYLTPKVAEILHLNKASVSDDVIVAYIEKSPSDYAVTARQLISLRDAGLSERVLKSLAEHRSPTQEELPAVPTVAPDASGRWIYVPGSGWYWQSAAPMTQPYGAEAFSPPLISGFVSDGGTVVVDDGHHHHHDHHVEHHNQGDQLATGHQPHNTGSDQTRMATPWLTHLLPITRVSNVPFGVLGGATPTAGQNPITPLDSTWLAGRPQGLAANIPYSPIGVGTLGHGQLWRGDFGKTASSSWISQGGVSIMASSSPFGVAGMPTVQNTGANPLLPVGGQLPSGNLPPYGIAGQPLVPNNGAYPFLPVGGVPASGTLPPYGVAGQPLVPNSGAYPFLPVGGQPASGNLPPYGIAPSSLGHGFQMAQFTPIPYLPAPPMLPSPPTLFNPATFPMPNSPPTGFFPSSPPTGFSTSAPRAVGGVGGFHSGGFHGGGGGFHGGGGGGGGHR